VDQDNIPVLAYGLRTDFRGETFEGSQYLLAWADEIREIKAICSCGRKATMNARVNANGEIERDGEQIEIGGNERYISFCRKCFSSAEVVGT
jgi:thymidine kinase